MRNLDKEYAPNDWRDYQYQFDVRVRKALLERWSPHFSPQGSALEMGSFDGSMTELILGYIKDLDVIEGSNELAKKVQEKFGEAVNVHRGWFEEFAPDRQYDHVFLVHGLEHVENPVGVLQTASSWLSERGRLYVAVPNANALSRQIAVRMGLVAHLQAVTQGEALHGHLRTYNLDTLRSDAVGASLKVEESGGVILKTLSNSQFDLSTESGVVSEDYIAACNELSLVWPDFSASIYVVLSRRLD